MYYIVSDHAGFELKEQLTHKFDKSDLELVDLTPEIKENDDYSDVAKILADKLLADPKSKGIAICGSGQGIMMSLNRYEHIRAGFSLKREIVRHSRLHNDANVLCLPGRFVNTTKAFKLIKLFYNTPFSKVRRHERRIEKISPNYNKLNQDQKEK
jgi:ribose 5-phosphate isomerase B